MTKGIELDKLVSVYHKVRSLALPFTAVYSSILYLLSWQNVPLSATALVLTVTFLLYPIYIQIILFLAIAAVFGLGYAHSVSPKEEFDRPVIDPAEYVNPRYYSLQSKKSLESKSKTVTEFKSMLSDLDKVFTSILITWDSFIDVVTWTDFVASRHVLIILCLVVTGPFFLSVNHTLVILTIYIFCGNSSFVSALTVWFASCIIPPDNDEKGPSGFSDSSDSDSELSVRSVIEDKFNESIDNSRASSSSRKSTMKSRDPNLSLGSESAELRCLTCGVTMTTGKVVKCGFCGCLNCGNCCRRTVYKSRLGVTNPHTKQHLVLVCNDCYSYLPKTESNGTKE